MSGDGFKRVWIAVLAFALVLAGVGGAAVGFGVPNWLAAAIGAVLALIASVISDRVYEAKAGRNSALEARNRVLDPLRAAHAISAGALRTATTPGNDRAMPAKNRAQPTAGEAASRTGQAPAGKDWATSGKRPSPGSAPAPADVLALLRADRSPMPFRARSAELRELDEWRADTAGSPVLLLSGSAGVGKTRLAIELGSRIPVGWAAGWLHAGMGGEAIAAVASAGEPCLILVDDADGRADVVALLDALAEHELADRDGAPAIRVLLVTRAADGLRASLAARVEERHAQIVTGAPTLELTPTGGADDQARWFDEAVRAFCSDEALRRHATELGLTPPALGLEHISTGHDAHAAPADPTEPLVMTQARALVAVLSRDKDAPDPRRLSFADVAAELMRHEKRRWDASAAAWHWGMGGPPSASVRERAVTALALLGADGEAEAARTLLRVPELEDASSERRHAIASWVASLYPSGATPRIRPDVLGEWLVVSQLTGNLDLARNLQADLSDEQASRALGLLARAADWLEPAGPLFGAFAGGDIRREVLAAVQATLTGNVGRNLLDPVLANQLESSAATAADAAAPPGAGQAG